MKYTSEIASLEVELRLNQIMFEKKKIPYDLYTCVAGQIQKDINREAARETAASEEAEPLRRII